MSAGLTLYELAGRDPDLRFSPHCWKTRMALAHKGLEATRLPWRFTDKDHLAFSGQGLVPVLIDDASVVTDSWRIALHLESRYPDRPSLFGAPDAVPLARFVNGWADTVLLPAVARLTLLDIFALIDPKDRAYFRASREKRFGATLEAVTADRSANREALAKAFTPLRHVLKDTAFLAGAQPAYADYCVFGIVMWARCVSDVALLEAGDPLELWREALLDRFDGLARSAPTAAAQPPLTFFQADGPEA